MSRHSAWKMALIVALLVAGCGQGLSAEEKQAFDDAMVVSKYFAASSSEGMSFYCGPFRGGTAVISGELAFWVKDGKGYAVNEEARAAAPELPQAPDEIVYDDAFIDAAFVE
jgi:hypothetical protein